MQIFSTVAVITAAIVALVVAEQQAHIKLRVAHDKFYVTPIGHQCAYNNCVDPSVYPCAKSTCVRLNYTYGICQENAGEQNYNDPKMLCPYPNPYNSKLGSVAKEAEEADEDETDEEDEAVHLRVHVSQDKGVCYLQCGSGQYCANGTNTCRKPAGKECFNPATGAFQNGCAAGFKCGNGKCIYA
ncbi:hypothetical protein BBO99_00008069 [Phytophthora kernoviae]|uniref:Uncharacterized protein n=2 Tax=Phytophthora kernoviae TaxID=325452 RepID=A0A3R7HEG4_9STRA|nr:hypothetical protein G195_009233 [Phytophthora kernoviae 00238/432]KAG2516534.1 hypothetical protein JM16_007623 [Phytophthora kernoviae]KAG2519476.1 hypothetical protein JM18_007531 [Phytophthora kernoviae]RLN06081.1 hypothetical protein BBI17_007995 [Phytophthora kernoviae]RLN75791.1 hypothetical protein BBO99_00008069 [Phytophthora kernoviae]